MNGTIAAVTSRDNTQSEDDSNRKVKSKGSRHAWSIMKRFLCIFYCFQVENPHQIDNYSRLSFPLSFMIVNVFYWVYYLYF